jgi:hypothetical protein
MGVLTAVLTHLDAPLVERHLRYLRTLAPDERFAVCHGGTRDDYDRLDEPGALFVDDPSLRGPHFDQSLEATLRALYEAHVRDDPEVEWVLTAEYDHLILRGDFAGTLTALAQDANAGLLAKWASPRNGSNWPHHLRVRDDERLNDYIAGISRREDASVRYGCLGSGLFFSRDAFTALCTLPDPPRAYFELWIPTALHHLGFDVVDIDAIADVYMDVRWLPEFEVEEARAAKRAGRGFIHPFKQIDALDAIG